VCVCDYSVNSLELIIIDYWPSVKNQILRSCETGFINRFSHALYVAVENSHDAIQITKDATVMVSCTKDNSYVLCVNVL
jgi:hypothetical protein